MYVQGDFVRNWANKMSRNVIKTSIVGIQAMLGCKDMNKSGNKMLAGVFFLFLGLDAGC